MAEDHNIVRNGIVSLLEKEPYFRVTGEAANGKEVLQLLEEGTEAEIVLADMNMPEMNGIALVEALKKNRPSIRVVVLSMLDHEKYIMQAFNTGVCGYLLKNVSADELIFAIKHVEAGGKYLCSELSFTFLDRLIYHPEGLDNEHSDIEFSKREIEVLTLIADGMTNVEIADKLFTSKRTVEGHRQNLIDKTGSRNTPALIRFAILNGVIN